MEENSPQKSSDSEERATIKKQLKELQMKVDVMTEVFEILKKGPGADIENLSNTEKHLIISALKNNAML